MNTALFGGTFNPPHTAHTALVEQVLSKTRYQRVVVVPVNQPAHKDLEQDPGPDHRLVMTRLAFGAVEGCIVEDWEVARGGVSYTVDTVQQLAASYTLQGKAGLIIGYDLVEELSSWRSWDELRRMVQFIIAKRDAETVDPKLTADLDCILLDNPLIDLSSSQVRSLCSAGRPFGHLVPEQVADYIKAMGLYGYRA